MRKMIGASESSSIYLWGICSSSILATLFSLFLVSTGTFSGMSVTSWVCYVIMQIAFILTVVVYSTVRKLDIGYICRLKKAPKPLQIVLLPFIAVATIMIFLPFANLWTSFLSLIGYSGSVATPQFDNVGVYFLALVIMALIPAFGEEFFMRGTVFPGLSTRGTWFGILMSGLFFSLMHANPYQTVHQFGLGVVLAIVLLITGSLWCGVIIHFLNNFISLTITAYIPEIDMWYIKLGYWNWLTGAASVIIGAFILVILLFFLYKVSNKDSGSYSNSVSGDGYTLYVSSDQLGVKKPNIFVQLGRFIKSLFTKSGWRKITNSLESGNNMQYLGKSQPMTAVWIALGLVIVYWFINFIIGLI